MTTPSPSHDPGTQVPGPGGFLKVDVVLGGPGREHAISILSGTAIAEGLRRCGHDVAVIEVAERLDPARLRPGSVVFNYIHGTYGEDGVLQAELDALGRAYVGCDAASSRLCMDKEATKQRLAGAGIRVPWGVAVDLGVPFGPRDLKLPHHGSLVLKPRDDGSSVGLKIIPNPSFLLPAVEELLRSVGRRRYLIEEQLPGPEYTVAVVDLGSGPQALPPLIIHAASGVFDYEAKYHRKDTIEDPVTDPEISAILQEIGLRSYSACGCRDLMRVDVMRTTDGGYAVLEVNTLPGMTAASLVPKSARAASISFDALVEALARRDWARRAVTVGSSLPTANP